MKRFMVAVFMALSLAAVGFFAGGLIAMKFMVSGTDGLAGGATVALLSLGGLLAGMIAGIVLAVRLPDGRLIHASAIALAAAIVAWVLLVTLGNHRNAAAPASASASPAGPVTAAAPRSLEASRVDSVIALVTAPAPILERYETREIAYEEPGILVFEQGQQSYLVRTKAGAYEWLSVDSTGRYEPIEKLIPNRLNYLTEAWDGLLLARPQIGSAATEVTLERRERETPAVVTGFSNLGGVLMFSVDVLAKSPCEGGEGSVVASGWVPAWAADGAPVAWFYSRGC